jgi:predicted metal-binding membrane protein
MFLGGWAMMTAVGMVPGTLPAARLIGVTRGAAHAVLFLGGYVTVWLAVGVVGYLALSPFCFVVESAGAGAALAATAAYELSPLKDACLRRCRSPLRILLQPTAVGSLRHAVDCVGCCAVLMGLMLALGVMSVIWLLVLAATVLVQKAAPLGEKSPRALAFVLASAAVLTWS